MAVNVLIVSLFETRKLWKLRPTQALPFNSDLTNSAREMDGPTLFVTHCNCLSMFNSNTWDMAVYFK